MIRVSVIGNLGRDATLRQSIHGQFASMSVGVNVMGKTLWLDVTLNNPSGKTLEILKKGKMVYIEGPMSCGTYQDGHGETQVYVKVTATTLVFCGSPKDNAE